MTKELIDEALRWANGHPNRRSGELMRELADALEAANAERAAVPDAATERERRLEAHDHIEDGSSYLDCAKCVIDAARAERDAALEAIERVRAEADAYAEQPDVMEPCGAVAQALRTALDGGESDE